MRMRRRKMMQSDDIFNLPIDEIPDAFKHQMRNGEWIISYEWKRLSVLGEENPFHIAAMNDQGWEPVPVSRHPNWVPPGYNKPHIIKGAQILMDRPIELTLEARREELQAANRQVRDAEARLGMTPRGEMTRNFPGIDNRITKEYVRPVMVPQGED